MIGGMRRLCLLLALLVSGHPAPALDMQDRLQLFATCAGRLSALMEHQWLFDGPESERTQMQRAAMLDLVAAIMPPGSGRQVLHTRIVAKQAQGALLTRATFNSDPADAAWAADRAAHQITQCTSLLPATRQPRQTDDKLHALGTDWP